MRGVQSSGMLCSARELGLSQDHAGLMELSGALAPGLSIRDALDLDDTLFTLKLTPNRADCCRSWAREVAALTARRCRCSPPGRARDAGRAPARQGRGPDLCGRFGGRVIRGVNARAATPEWMNALERAGQRSLSALVDISNYVMLELGRPSHVFDLDKIQGDSCRRPREGETLELLNGQTVTLDSKVGVVVAGDTVESLAGIMGGEATSVTLDTQNIYLEAAFWWPQSLAGRAPLSSEASHRGERGVDYATIPEHIEFITRLIVDICGGQAGPLDDQIVNLPKREPVRMRLARCHRVLGVPVTQADVGRIFGSLGLEYTIEGDDFVVTPPSFRFDIEIERPDRGSRAHLRLREHSTVPPMARAKMFSQPEVRRGNHALRRLAAARDYQEVVSYGFVEADWGTRLRRQYRPRAPGQSHRQPSVGDAFQLIAGLVANIVHNANRKQTRVRLFELGRVFTPTPPRRTARWPSLACVSRAAGRRRLGPGRGAVGRARATSTLRREDGCRGAVPRAARLRFEAAAHPALHPGRSARVSLDGKVVRLDRRTAPALGAAGRPGPCAGGFELDVAAAEASCPRSASNRASPSWCATWPCGSTPRCRSSPCWTPSPRWPRPIPGWPCCAICACSTCGAKSQDGVPAAESLAFRFWLGH